MCLVAAVDRVIRPVGELHGDARHHSHQPQSRNVAQPKRHQRKLLVDRNGLAHREAREHLADFKFRILRNRLLRNLQRHHRGQLVDRRDQQPFPDASAIGLLTRDHEQRFAGRQREAFALLHDHALLLQGVGRHRPLDFGKGRARQRDQADVNVIGGVLETGERSARCHSGRRHKADTRGERELRFGGLGRCEGREPGNQCRTRAAESVTSVHAPVCGAVERNSTPVRHAGRRATLQVSSCPTPEACCSSRISWSWRNGVAPGRARCWVSSAGCKGAHAARSGPGLAGESGGLARPRCRVADRSRSAGGEAITESVVKSLRPKGPLLYEPGRRLGRRNASFGGRNKGTPFRARPTC